MILGGARVALGPDEAVRLDVEIRGEKIAALRPPGPVRRPDLDLNGCLILPGLINAHDHLEFALFPRLGRGPYPNAGAWARDIYRPKESPVREQLGVPKAVRLVWGGLRNLLGGVTTVCHHNPRSAVFGRHFPVRVMRRFGWAHSLEFSPDLAARFRRTPAGWPFIVHLGEATDREGAREIFRLDEMGALGPRTVLVHGVALDRRGLRLAREKGGSLVWCPSSNLFTLGRTLSPSALRNGIPVALGTDSSLTAKGDLLDEIRAAQRVGLDAADLYRLVTEQAAGVLRLDTRAGTLAVGGAADILVVRDRGRSPAVTLLGAVPEMVLLAGKIKLASPGLAAQLPATRLRRLRRLAVEGRPEVLVDADVPQLYRQAARVLGPQIRLAGRRVLA